MTFDVMFIMTHLMCINMCARACMHTPHTHTHINTHPPELHKAIFILIICDAFYIFSLLLIFPNAGQDPLN